MKKLSFILSFFLFICLLIGCRKDPEIPPTIVNGQVLEQGTNKPLEGVKVVLMEGTYNGSSLGTYSYYPVDTFLTDKSGKFNYEHKKPFNGKSYEIWYFKQDYFDISNIEDNTKITYVEDNKTVNTTVKMYPFAWLSIHITNNQPLEEFDFLRLTIYDNSGKDYNFMGNNVNEVLIKKVVGNSKNTIRWSLYKNSKWTTTIIDSTIYCKGRDTTLYELKY
jgi:hypothetical protein